MVLTTLESSKINTMESPLQHDEIRPIQAANLIVLIRTHWFENDLS